ncbi:MAG: Asp-tRNA(Asn)/Glu-tRNA(Gln) amidotransferase subunit GatA [Planctomycetaceae bacterium]|nr:Asp-tRNA(Asn)/Glu-tRNA(Gln) amidotransferase subunit GatA [Planctomycetaceae bacterium]
MSLTRASTDELLQLLDSREVSAVEVATAFLDEIEARDEQIGAFLTVDRDGALTAARTADERRAAGESAGLLGGIPVAVKDLVCTRGLRTTCASRMLENFVPPYDAHVVRRLRDEGAVLLGKVNLDEFAMGSSTETSAFRRTVNPWNSEHSPGGSSGGSAAAIAAGLAPLSIGSDTGGSIRQPASFCGVVGLKPTYGRVSRYGLVAFASSLDQLGPLSRDVSGSARLLQVIAGHDPQDATCLNVPVPDWTGQLEQPLEGLKIGVVAEQFADGLDDEVAAAVRAAVEVYRGLGATVEEIELPHARHSVATYYLIAPCEASSNLARYDGVHYGHRAEQFDDMVDMYAASRGEAFGSEVKRRIMLGTWALSSGYYEAYYLKALKVRRLIRQDFDDAFRRVDLIAGPVTPTTAFRTGELTGDPLAMYLADIYTSIANLAGIPGISIPAGISQAGLPIGLQLLAPSLEEDRLLRAARMYERETNWHTRWPASL